MSSVARTRTAATPRLPTIPAAIVIARSVRACPREGGGSGSTRVVGRARGRAIAGAVLPRRVLAAGQNRRHRLPEQGRDLRHPVQGLGRDHDYHRGRSQAPRRPHRCALCPPYLGLGAQSPSACPYDRSGRRISLDGARWVACRPDFLLYVGVLSRLFRRLVLEKLTAAHSAGELQFFSRHAALANTRAFAAYLAPLRNSKWVVYCKRSFAGPEQVLRYLARYTHRVAISNRRLLSLDVKGVTFKWKDYRLEGRERYQVMTLATDEFIRRFLMHVLPAGFHRIRYYGLLASGKRADNIARARELLTPPIIPVDAIKAANTNADQPQTPEHRCPCCCGRMIIIERFERGATPRSHPSPPTPVIRIDTS